MEFMTFAPSAPQTTPPIESSVTQLIATPCMSRRRPKSLELSRTWLSVSYLTLSQRTLLAIPSKCIWNLVPSHHLSPAAWPESWCLAWVSSTTSSGFPAPCIAPSQPSPQSSQREPFKPSRRESLLCSGPSKGSQFCSIYIMALNWCC